MAASQTGNLKKAGRPVSGARMAALEQTVKTLLQMMAGAGSAKAQKAITAMADGDEMTISQAIGSEFQKAMTPLAGAVLNINDRLLKIEAQPTSGGPVLRIVDKVIGRAREAPQEKPQPTALVKAQIDNLWRQLNTEVNPQQRAQYQAQYDALKAQYQ
jgi:hypothetical protein